MELRDRLARLGVHLGAAGLKLPPPTRRGPGIEEVIAGEVADTPHGPYFLVQRDFAPDHVHGGRPLAALLDHPPEIAAQLGRDAALHRLDFRRTVFLDVETTGLACNTGTYVFLVGVGAFEDEGFRLCQFFMRDPLEERAMLHALGEYLDRFAGVVTFNGKGFDLPLLETRFITARLAMPYMQGIPHLDLLYPARQLWRRYLSSCALSSLELQVLGVERDQADVPGWLIPSLYFQYLRDGDARPLASVFYHNVVDILSMVTLATHMCNLAASPQDAPPSSLADLLGLAHLLYEQGDVGKAEAAYRRALAGQLAPHLRCDALFGLAALLKRQGRGDEALSCWEMLGAEGGRPAILACVELAKYYEWQAHDASEAIRWARRALELAEAEPPGLAQQRTLAEIRHRLCRLEGKLLPEL
jgi:uncharacterized protein YprB with RNaseH-like and TPR domain